MQIKSLINTFRLNHAGVHDAAFTLARFSVFLFLIVLPFGHNAALKNIAVLGLLIALIWLMRHRQIDTDWRSPILLSMAGMLLGMLLPALSGIDPIESLGELRKHFLPGILLFLIIPVTFRSEHLIRLLLSVITIAFLVRTLLTLSELAFYLPDINAGRLNGIFIKGFSLDAGFYLPIIMTLLLIGGRWRWLATLGLPSIFVVMLLTQSRAPVIAAIVAIIGMLFLLRQWRILLSSLLIVVATGVYVGITKPEIAHRYATTISSQTYAVGLDNRDYQPSDGFSGRTAIWSGILEITQPRPWAGYGFGWKKLGPVAVEQGYVTRWAAQENDMFAAEQARYFSQNPATVNPHNVYLQIYFESGLVGLLSYVLLLLILFVSAIRIAWQGNSFNRLIGAMVFAYLLDHVILGMFNALLIGLGPSIALIALLETVRRSEKTA